MQGITLIPYLTAYRPPVHAGRHGHGGMYVNLVTCALSETAADFRRWRSHSISNRLYIKELTGVK